MGRVTPLCAALLLLGSVAAGRTDAVELAAILGNAGFEDDLDHSEWTATQKSHNYRVDAPVVNPTIVPFGHAQPLEAPDGDNFVGVLNPQDADINGRLVHEVVAGPYPSGTIFTVTLFASRGRLPAAGTGTFGTAASEVTL